ncbi:MAG TPA: phosphoadenylyl-sulfate reductase [Gemmatimonadales bacterium]|nr:phosphoadenylyl-sulfate reductase [Gemmatimonadales bacterium]
MHIVREPDDIIGDDSAPERVVAWMLERFVGRELVLTTSFGMEGCALIDMVAAHRRPVRVVYLDTMFLFPETYRLRDRMAARYPHLRFENRGTSLTPDEQERLFGPELWRRDPDACCRLRKVEPMRAALAGVDVWVTGLTRSQSASRAALEVVAWDWQYQLVKVNPLAGWTRAQVYDYVRRHEVPYNELHERGYPSIGCTHCTVAVPGSELGEYSREGRWTGEHKTECGLHRITPRVRIPS